MPDAFVAAGLLAGFVEAPLVGPAKTTGTPWTGLPPAMMVATSGLANMLLTEALWPPPLVGVIVADESTPQMSEVSNALAPTTVLQGVLTPASVAESPEKPT